MGNETFYGDGLRGGIKSSFQHLRLSFLLALLLHNRGTEESPLSCHFSPRGSDDHIYLH